MSPMPENFAQRLKTLRKKAGLTQEQLANILDVSYMTIRRWEWGKGTPRLEEIKALAKALNVSENDLLNDPAPPSEGWVLQIKIEHSHQEEVIDMRKNVPVQCSITATPEGAYLTVGGHWSLWTDENKKELIKQINKFFGTVQQNGIALGGLPKP